MADSQARARPGHLTVWRGFAVVAILLSQSACSTLGYYAQSVGGHLSLMNKRRPIAELVNAPETPEALKEQLRTTLAIREFATRELGLPDNGSYRSYVDLKRPYVVWNVVATPEFSLAPKQWCFPVAGCVSYRGYFSRNRAQGFAHSLRTQGYDVLVAGARAYSTLGWFDDPVLSTLLNQPNYSLAGVIFHELAHQRLYIKNDSTFNEGFALTVQREGVSRWLQANGQEDSLASYMQARRQQDDFLRLVKTTRERLECLYTSSLDTDPMRRAKARLFEKMRADYETLKAKWGGVGDYDQWFTADLNNAKLSLVNTYGRYVPLFEALLDQYHGDLPAFYRAAEELGRQSRAARETMLWRLALGSGEHQTRLSSATSLPYPCPNT